MKILLSLCIILGSMFAQQLSPSAVQGAQDMVILSGYKCDTVSNQPHFSQWDGSVTVICNNNRYVYELKDVGGRWTVRVK